MCATKRFSLGGCVENVAILAIRAKTPKNVPTLDTTLQKLLKVTHCHVGATHASPLRLEYNSVNHPRAYLYMKGCIFTEKEPS